METILFWAALVAVGIWLYEAGKREGSRKAFTAGRADRKGKVRLGEVLKHRVNRFVLVLLVVGAILTPVFGVAVWLAIGAGLYASRWLGD